MSLDLSQLNAEQLRNSVWENRLKKYDPHLYLRYDQVKNRWLIFEFYEQNGAFKPLFWLEDDKGEPKEFGEWVFNKLNVMRMRWEHKEELGVNRWFDELEEEADRQHDELEEKERQEALYMYKHDKLQWRKGKRELMNEPASDVFAGYQYNPPHKKRGTDVKPERVDKPTEL